MKIRIFKFKEMFNVFSEIAEHESLINVKYKHEYEENGKKNKINYNNIAHNTQQMKLN